MDDREQTLGHRKHTWSNLYDSLVLHTGKHMSALPGLRAVVVATGIASNPMQPELPNQAQFSGVVRHSITYKNPAGVRGRHVLVVGVGNSGGEIAAELSRAGARVTLAVRNGAHVVAREVLGVPIQYLTVPLGYLPRRVQRAVTTVLGSAIARMKSKSVLPPPRAGECPRVPLIGFHLAEEIRKGAINVRGDIASFTTDGVRFTDGVTARFDEVIFATGFRAAMGMLNGLVRLDPCGFALRRNRVVSIDQPDLYFVGHNPDIRGGIFMIGRDARRAAKWIRHALDS